MQDRFDPYQHWLGIPPAQQPPHHYRLLGIAPLEANPETIRRAADQQAAAVRRHQSSQYLAVTNKLLADISAAVACLLNPQTKAAYDAALRQQLGASAPQRPWQAGAPAANLAGAPAPQSPAAPPVVGPPPGRHAGPPPAPAAPPIAPPMTAASGRPSAGMAPVVSVSPPRRRSSIPWPAVGLLLIAVGTLAGVLWMVFRGDDSVQRPAEQVAESGDPTAAAVPPESPPPPIATPPDEPDPAGAPMTPRVEPAPADIPAEPPPEERIPEPSPPEAIVTPKTTQRRGDAEVAVLSATVGRDASATALEEGRLEVGDPNAVSLVLNLELRNAGDTQPLKYFSWAGLTAFDVPVALRDDRDRSYRQKTPLDQSYPNQPEAEANVYVITEENFRQKVLQSDKPVLVQVYAPWSEACQSLMPAVDHLSAEYADKVIVGRLQVADAGEPGKFTLTPLLQQYKIESIPVVLVFNKGKPVNGWAGVVPLGTMEEELDALLPPKPPAYETLPPGAAIQQRLIFEPPDEEAKALHLTLPGSAVGVEGTFELVLPRGMVVGAGNDDPIAKPE